MPPPKLVSVDALDRCFDRVLAPYDVLPEVAAAIKEHYNRR